MRKWLVLIVLILASCSSPTSTYVIFDNQTIHNANCYIDGEQVGNVLSGNTSKFTINEGTHTFEAVDGIYSWGPDTEAVTAANPYRFIFVD